MIQLGEIGAHEVQAIITVTLLIGTSVLALSCDYLRYRMYRRRTVATAAVPELRTPARAHTLVPEFEVPVAAQANAFSQLTAGLPAAKLRRASRLSEALQEHRRSISPALQEIIERNSRESAGVPNKTTAGSSKNVSAAHAG